MDINVIEKYAATLANNIRLKADYRTYLNHNRKIVIVEGSTDCDFMKNIKRDDVDCFAAKTVLVGNDIFRSKQQEKINYKQAIITLIEAIQKYPSPFIKYAGDVDKWDVYGIVDSDGKDNPMLNRLVVTDTHDIETLIISSDENVLRNVEGCDISDEEIKRTHYLAYQLEMCRSFLFDMDTDMNLNVISCGGGLVDFDHFVVDGKIKSEQLIDYVNMRNGNALSASQLKKMHNSFVGNKQVKKYITNGTWKKSIDEFVANIPEDFWFVVNGHDFLQILAYYSESAKKFRNRQYGVLNRDFENAIIAAYDYSKLINTEAGKKMKACGLIN